MPDYHTTIRLMNTDFPVTVTWDVCGIDDGAPEYELEAVVSDLLGDVTHLVLNSLQGHTFVHYERDTGWQDPIRVVMFGQDTVYATPTASGYPPSDWRIKPWAQPHPISGPWSRPQVVQREPIRRVLRTFGDLRQKIFDEIDELREVPDRVQAHYDCMASD